MLFAGGRQKTKKVDFFFSFDRDLYEKRRFFEKELKRQVTFFVFFSPLEVFSLSLSLSTFSQKDGFIATSFIPLLPLKRERPRERRSVLALLLPFLLLPDDEASPLERLVLSLSLSLLSRGRRRGFDLSLRAERQGERERKKKKRGRDREREREGETKETQKLLTLHFSLELSISTSSSEQRRCGPCCGDRRAMLRPICPAAS